MSDRAGLTSVRTKVFYGLGSIAFGVKDNGFQTFVLLFYSQVIGMPAYLVGLAVGLANICDAFVDPLIGQISDNWHSRWGRRHPFMYAAALPVSVSYLLLWNPPHWSDNALFFYLFAVSIVIRTFISCYEVPSAALVAELTDDYDQRTTFLSYRFLFGWAGGLGMAIMAYRYLLRPDAAHPVGQLNPAGYANYGLVAGLVMFTVIIVSSLGTHRFIPEFHVPPQRRIGFLTLLKEMFATLSHRSFLMLSLALIFVAMATGVVFALTQYFYTFIYLFSAKQISNIQLSGILSAALAFSIAAPISRRFGKKWPAVSLFATGMILGSGPLILWLMGLFPVSPSPVTLPGVIAATIVAITLTTASSILFTSMLTDVVEDSELRTGRRSEGVFFAASSFIQKSVSGLGMFLSGIVLWLAEFPQHATPGKIAHASLVRLALIELVTVLALYSIALVCVSFYRISRKDHEENLRRLAAEQALAQTPIGDEAVVHAAPDDGAAPRPAQ